MTEQEFKDYTKQITLRVVSLIEQLPNSQKAKIIGDQLLESAASIGANYQAACRGTSAAHLIKYLSKVESDADRALYWLDILVEAKVVDKAKLIALTGELNQIVKMTASSISSLQPRQEGKILEF